MKQGNRHLLLAAAVLLLAGVVMCQGRVFLKWGAASKSTGTIEALGGQSAYEAAVTLNGGDGKITVFWFDKGLRETVAALAKAFGIEKFQYKGGTMAMLTVEADDRVIRLIAVDLGGYNQTQVFKFEQSTVDAKLSGMKPTEHLMTVVPPYPGSEPLFYAKDNNTGMSVEMSSAAASDVSIREFYNSSLADSGWKPAFPGLNSSLAVFMKGNDICCVLASADDNAPGGSRITVLHKPLSLK